MKLNDLFEIEYPKTLIFSEMTISETGINFVSSQNKNNGVVARVEECEGVKKYPAGVITVPLKGSVLMAHVQNEECYVAHQVAVLTPKTTMDLKQKLFYCLCIQKNVYRFNYGRQADRTLSELSLPDILPEWVEKTNIVPIRTKNRKEPIALNIKKWKGYKLSELFHFEKGKRLTKTDMISGNINFLGAISDNNGIREKIETDFCWKPNCITVNYNGSVGEAFYQDKPFWASDDVNVLYAKEGWLMNKYNALFIITVIKANKYRFSYGRKWTLEKMKESIIKLPCKKDGMPDFGFMEKYIKSLPYSDRI